MSQEKFRSQLSSFADAAVFQGIPHLRLSPATHTLELYLPALTAGYEPEDPQWTVSAQLLNDSEDTRKFYYVEGEEPGLWISMPHPFSHLSVSFEEHTLEFAGVANGGLVLDSTHRPLDTTAAIPKGSYTFIAPAGTEFTKAKAGEARSHGAWEGWSIFPLEVSQSFTVEAPQQEPATIKVSGSPDFAWDMAVKSLPNAHGLDGELVYTQSPRVIANTELSMESVSYTHL